MSHHYDFLLNTLSDQEYVISYTMGTHALPGIYTLGMKCKRSIQYVNIVLTKDHYSDRHKVSSIYSKCMCA